MEDIKVNQHGVNIKIKVTVLPEEKMRHIGFTDYAKDRWYFCRVIKFPDKKRYKNFIITFGVSIVKNNPEDFRIDVLDDAYCQPYDYQAILENNPNFEPCLIVKEQVEEWMKYLQDEGVLSGHKFGEYI